ncbi:MAG TPA: isoprenylcysteine carboxylmethyltransferase family protein [Gammaproteobacteria bacterium]|nr:isoprenylcysteine carboxylmethyltransferase family protein [Gammaproteobacteria bacterium]
MHLSHWLILASWLVFTAYWAIMAVGVKRNIGKRPWGKETGMRVAIVVLVLLVVWLPALRHALLHMQYYLAGAGMALGLAGAALCVLGVGFAIWARATLGRNWGMPMSRKEDPELVTGGPYAYVRHPIYGGILMAMLGSALGGMLIWSIPLVLCVVYFVYSARNEEKLMLEQFPEQYPAYMKRTKMLLPFIV